jgi:hypothetical protein
VLLARYQHIAPLGRAATYTAIYGHEAALERALAQDNTGFKRKVKLRDSSSTICAKLPSKDDAYAAKRMLSTRGAPDFRAPRLEANNKLEGS